MLRDAASVREDSCLEADFAIVGSGPAGLALATSLAAAGKSVCLLESGAQEANAERSGHYSFTSTELPVALESRSQGFGGTTDRWAGRWKWLDPIDFESRSWVPYSGWPVNYEELLPYYRAADHFAGFDAPGAPHEGLFREDPALTVSPMRFQEPSRLRWSESHGRALVMHPAVDLLLDAHVTEIKKAGAEVSSLTVRSSRGQFSVRARAYLLAAGGIENPRLLLASGIGNEHDQVGRYYMDHPKRSAGYIEGYGRTSIGDSAYFSLRPGLRTTYAFLPVFQKAEEALNSHFILEPALPKRGPDRVAERLFHEDRPLVLATRLFLEQAPRPENRVTLSTVRDRYLMPQASVAWTIGRAEQATARLMHKELRRAAQQNRIGELVSPLLEREEVSWSDASHHMGTTRMGTDPRLSVVDSDCRVHGVSNLFIAGSSVFPTGGSAPPTATIVALALRLADRLTK